MKRIRKEKKITSPLGLSPPGMTFPGINFFLSLLFFYLDCSSRDAGDRSRDRERQRQERAQMSSQVAEPTEFMPRFDAPVRVSWQPPPVLGRDRFYFYLFFILKGAITF